jgi:hypothetical protein
MRKLYLTGIRGVPREALEDAFNKYGKIAKLSTGAQDFGFCVSLLEKNEKQIIE